MPDNSYGNGKTQLNVVSLIKGHRYTWSEIVEKTGAEARRRIFGIEVVPLCWCFHA